MYDLIAVTNRKLCRGDFFSQIRLLVGCGVPKILLREKDLSPEEYEVLAEKVLKICQGSQTQCILHNFIDVAAALGADAIHLPLHIAESEKTKLAGFSCVGISTHSIEQVKAAETLGASYVTYGHVFATDCKLGVPPRGLAALTKICEETKLPVYAIGGISVDNLAAVRQSGAKGACIMSEAMRADTVKLQRFLEL